MRTMFRCALFAAFASIALPAPGGAAELRRGNDSEPDSLDPARANSAWENNIIGDQFLGLTTEDMAAQPVPGAAEKWTTSPDGLVWTFTLRPGLVWSDGAPLKASDFVFGMRRVLDPKTAARYAFILNVIKNAEQVNAGKLPPEQAGVRAIDDRTLEITLEAPTPFLPGLLTHYTAYPIPEHVIRKLGDDWVKPGNSVSNGPFVLSEWVPHDHITLKKNPRFYDAAHVALDSVVFVPIENDSQALARYRAGGIDAFLGKGAFPANELALVQELLPGQAHIESMLVSEYLVANMRRKPFDDARVRRAISLCIDRDLLASKVYRDGSLPAYSFVPPGIADYRGGPRVDFADWPMDKRRDEARRLLAEAGFTAKHPLEFEYRTMSTTRGRRDIVTQSAMLKECGIITHVLINEPKVYYSALQQFDYTFGWSGWVADYNDPYTFLYLMDSRAKAYNYPGYNNPAYDRLLDQAQQTLDVNARAEILAKAEQLMLDETGLIPLDFATDRTLVQTYVKGYVDNPVNTHRSRWISLDRPTQ